MAPSLPEKQLKALVDGMIASGFLDEQFLELQKLRDDRTPEIVADVVELFCKEGDRILGVLAKLLENPAADLDFKELNAVVHQLRGSSGSVGSRKVKSACVELVALCHQKNRDGCLMKLETVKTEFYQVREKFQIVLKLERQIQNLPPK